MRKRCRRSGKVIYLKGEARTVLEKRIAQKGRLGSIYLCDYCGGWHLTKQLKGIEK